MPDDAVALRRKSFAGIAFLHLVLAVTLFWSAGTVRWWQAWAYLGVFLASTLGITLHFLERDPDLIRRRLPAGPTAEAGFDRHVGKPPDPSELERLLG